MRNHESALLVVLSYIIGFITAFIMFNLVDGKNYNEVREVDHNQDSDTPVVEEAGIVEVMKTAEGLFVKKDGNERIISAFDEEADEVGFHLDISLASVSNDGQFVHYCSSTASSVGNCQHFVYSVAEDKIYMVKNDDAGLETSSAEASTVSWSEGSTLSYSGKLASSASKWVMR